MAQFVGTSLEELANLDPNERFQEYTKFDANNRGGITPGSYNPSVALSENQPSAGINMGMNMGSSNNPQSSGGYSNNVGNSQYGNFDQGGSGDPGNRGGSNPDPREIDQYKQQIYQLQQQQAVQQAEFQRAYEALQQQQNSSNNNANLEAQREARKRSERKKYNHIDKLRKEIKNDLNNINPNDINGNVINQNVENKEDIILEKKKNYLSYWPNILLDAFIILILYIILSQPQVIKFFGKYIKILNPDKECSYPLFGIIIYGLMLACLYSLVQVSRVHLINY